jgi:NAD-dependent deacetylase
MHGALDRLCCERDRHGHPTVAVAGAQDPTATCARCGAHLRPDIVWFGEVPMHLDEIGRALSRCAVFLSVGTSGVVYPAAGFVDLARRAGARCLEINPEPSGGAFHATREEGAEVALPALVAAWREGRTPPW